MTTSMPAPGRFRYAIVALLFVVTSVNYADRSILAITAPVLAEQLGIDALSLGWVFSAFGWAYVAAQVPGGWLLDRFGSRRVYFCSILCWSLLTGAQGLLTFSSGATAVVTLFMLRLMVGLAEAPAFPGNARVVAAWFPASERGTASAIFNSAQYFATVLFAPLMGGITHVFGWPWTYGFMGGLGLLVSLLWLKVMQDPARHPRVGAAELKLIIDGGGMADLDGARRGGLQRFTLEQIRVLFTDRSMIGLYIGQFAINTLTYFFITWFPVYLVQQRGMSVMEAGFSASLPAICGFAGGVLGGVWSDFLLRRGASLTVARKTPVVAGMLIAICIVGCNYVDSPAMVLLFMSIAFFGKGIGALGWAIMADVAPRQLAGLSGGIFNTFGNLSSIITPIVIGAIVQFTGSFDMALVFVAANALLAVGSFLFVIGQIRRIEIASPAADAA
ncbi:MAG: MFS transporter [Gammaproteobacteria bacterium]|nr:MFS transporter [Gammaproteobacteria bacterium]